jgi:dsRNA-specific ribonuclease
MNKLANIHNKTKELNTDEMPFNNKNILLSENELKQLFHDNGLKDIVFHNINIYRNAFVHKSYCTLKNADFNTGNAKCPDDCLPLQEMAYERLEFLGDSLLGMIVAGYLYERFPDQSEGFLSKLRTKLVNGKMLGFLSEKIGFPKFAIISKQVEDANGRNNYKIMEDIFEAFIGAIYLDFQNDKVDIPVSVAYTGNGFYIVQKWIIHIIENYLDISELIVSRTNYKDMLVSYMQHHLQDQPKFFEINIITRDNSKIFTYCVKDKHNTVIATAKGPTKKDAENNVSLEALKHYNVNYS